MRASKQAGDGDHSDMQKLRQEPGKSGRFPQNHSDLTSGKFLFKKLPPSFADELQL